MPPSNPQSESGCQHRTVRLRSRPTGTPYRRQTQWLHVSTESRQSSAWLRRRGPLLGDHSVPAKWQQPSYQVPLPPSPALCSSGTPPSRKRQPPEHPRVGIEKAIGDPATEIVSYAQKNGIDLLVLGT